MRQTSAERYDEAAIEASAAGKCKRPPRLLGGSAIKGHLDELAADNLALFERCAAIGGLVRFRVYWFQCHIVTDPDLAIQMLVDEAAAFKKTRGLQIARPTFGNGLVTSEGEQWRRQQRLLRGFFTPRAAEGYGELMSSEVNRKLSTWCNEQIVDLHADMVDVSLEIVCRALFGLDAEPLKPLIRGAADAVQNWHSYCNSLCLPYPHFYPTPANYRYRAQTRELDRAVCALIRSVRTKSAGDHGLLGALLGVRDEDGTGISDREIRDQVVTMFLAGHDTTAACLAFALYELSFRPDLQQRIVQELLGQEQSETLEHALKETLRLYPAVHLVGRTALRDVRLGEFLVRQGEEVIVPLYVMQRSPKLFPRAPNVFVPERWTETRMEAACPRHGSLPFSKGQRICIGQSVALAELRTVIGAVLQRFRLEPIGPRNPIVRHHMTLAPAQQTTRVRVIARAES